MRLETPRAVLVIVATSVAAAGLVFGILGYKIGQTPPAPIVIQLPPPAANH